MDKYRRRKRIEPSQCSGQSRSDRLCNSLEFDSNVASSLEAVKKEFDKFTQQDATFIFVTNEIGWGGVSENKLQRKFTDLQGWTNQYIASHADDVYLMASGIPVKIK